MEPLRSVPCLCILPHRARPAPRPVAAREYPHREALLKVFASEVLVPRASVLSSASSLGALVTTRCFPQLLVSFLRFVWSSRAPSLLLACLSFDRDLLALRCRAIMLRLEELACELLCCNCRATSRARCRSPASASRPVSLRDLVSGLHLPLCLDGAFSARSESGAWCIPGEDLFHHSWYFKDLVAEF